MELVSIEIKNYRSIEEVEIEINENCLIFLGINESGKTNILKAISALSDEFEFDFQDDSKIPIDDEKYEFKKPTFRYNFELTPAEKKEIVEKAFGETYQNWPFKHNTTYCKSLNQFFDKFIGQAGYQLTFKADSTSSNSVIYIVDKYLLNLKEDFFYCKNEVQATVNGEARVIATGEIIDTSENEIVDFETIKQHFESVTNEYIVDSVVNILAQYVRSNLPTVVYWKYDPRYLLTDSIDILAFKDDPSTCLPLRNIFWLAGIEEIGERITRDYENDSAFHNLKERLSKAATRHLNQAWKDYKGITLIVNERNGKFSIQVKDSKNLFNFKQRSDGFKRFISFLFILSAEYQADELHNSILIYDEPDISLHPSGTRHLLEEVLELSNGNYSFVATHSIFFIDRDNISRHLIVTKENECTKIEPASYQNFADEEVLYQALGFSLYDILKTRNFCFEGWTDKELFRSLTNLFKDDIAGLADNLKNYGILWSSGASKICQTIKPFISNDDRRFFVIADFDGSGNKEKKVFETEFCNTRSKFFTYKDFSRRQLTELTLEDSLPVSVMVNFFNEYIEEVTGNSPSPRFTQARIDKSGIINSWKKFCRQEYQSDKNHLTAKYKNKIPEYIQKYLDDNRDDIDRVKTEFGWYKTFITKLFEETER